MGKSAQLPVFLLSSTIIMIAATPVLAEAVSQGNTVESKYHDSSLCIDNLSRSADI